MKIVDMVNRGMLCSRCLGIMLREPNFDLPKGCFEFYCINCGMRLWINQKTMEMQIYVN